MFISKNEKRTISHIFKLQTKTTEHMINKINDLEESIDFLDHEIISLSEDLTKLEHQLAILQRDTKRAKARK